MRIVFLDANILISVLNKEYPLFISSARVLSLADAEGFKLYTSALSLGITHYFAEKKSGRKMANKKISLFLEKIHIVDCGHEEAQQVISLGTDVDFEDALQYFSACNSMCSCIVSSNLKDYYFSSLPVLTPAQFLKELN